MPVAALIPIRSFSGGKERLSSSLSPETRARLVMAMARRTMLAAEDAAMLPAIVTSEPAVSEWAAGRGLPVIPETAPELDQAARDGVAWAESNALQWVVIHSDLPLVTPADLEVLASLAASGIGFVAPSADGGSSAVSAPGPIPFGYGRLSMHRHLGQIAMPRVISRVGLLHDLDNMNDLQSAVGHPRGSWLRAIVA